MTTDVGKAKPRAKVVEMSEEDTKLRQSIELLVTNLQDSSDMSAKRGYLETLKEVICAATGSMTSVPKPLKFLISHFGRLQDQHRLMRASEGVDMVASDDVVALFSDIMSCVSLVSSEPERLEMLRYKVLCMDADIGAWGFEYVRGLTVQINKCYMQLEDGECDFTSLETIVDLSRKIVDYLMAHNAEAEAVDLLMEIERLDLVVSHLDTHNYEKVCLYLMSCVEYVSEGEDHDIMRVVLAIYMQHKKYVEAVFTCLKLRDYSYVNEIFHLGEMKQPENRGIRLQIAYILASSHCSFAILNSDLGDDEELVAVLSNSNLSGYFVEMVDELELTEGKLPEDVFKTQAGGGFGGSTIANDLFGLPPSTTGSVGSAAYNLGASIANGLLNCGYGHDKLIKSQHTESADEFTKWPYNNKDLGMLTATASLGWLHLWDLDGGLNTIDPYIYASEPAIQAGALLACGVITSHVHNEVDPALSLLQDYLHPSTSAQADTVQSDTVQTDTVQTGIVQAAALMGLGIAYAGTRRKDVKDQLIQSIQHTHDHNQTKNHTQTSHSWEALGAGCIGLGLVFAGSADREVTECLVDVLMQTSEEVFVETMPHSVNVVLGLAMNYLGKQAEAQTTLELVKVLPTRLSQLCCILIDACAYCGSGNVLKVQDLLQRICDRSVNSSSSSSSDGDELFGGLSQSVCVLGMALVAMGEEIGAEMSIRMLTHVLQYGDGHVRKMVPLALALMFPSHPKAQPLDMLSKLSHDSDVDVAHNSILALGLLAAGTNNARVASMLRQLAVFYQKDKVRLLATRIAQGLLHLGKGALSISPFRVEQKQMSMPAVASLLAVLVGCIDAEATLLANMHYHLYYLTPAIFPRMCLALDSETLKPVKTNIRVGQAIDVVGQVGKPRTITGFQTHTTPILLSHGEKAELATEEYLTLTPILEGIVLLKKNPQYTP